MASHRSEHLVSASVLLDEGTEEIRFVDGSWHLTAERNARAEHADAHLPGAVFFDIDKVSDTNSSLPHMLPTPERFAAAAGALGLAETDNIVVYDTVGIFSAPRVWWTFRTMGARRVRVLDGGLPAWRAAGGAVEAGASQHPAGSFTASFDPRAVIDAEKLTDSMDHLTIIDARPAPRFRGEAPEPRPGLRAGHMPGAVNIPAANLVQNGHLASDAFLRRAFGQACRPGAAIVTTCGSGVTAATLTLALATLGVPSRLYDGSWAEWGAGAGAVATAGQGSLT